MSPRFGFKFAWVIPNFFFPRVLCWNQLGRRNLKPDVSDILRGEMQLRAKKKQGSNNQYVQAKSEKSQIETFQNMTEDQKDIARAKMLIDSDTAQRVAEQTGVSRAKVFRDAKKAEEFRRLKEVAPGEARPMIWT